MKNNFDLKGYMKSNQVGSYQQLNEMWYQDITQALGDFNEAKVITEEEMEDSTHQEMIDDIIGKSNGDKDQEYDFTVEVLKQHQIHNEDQLKAFQKFAKGANYHAIANAIQDVLTGKVNLEEMGGVKNIGDKAKLATPNTRPNLGRHRSSDTLDKQVAKDHDKKTVVGAKAAAYKAPHMKEEEAADDIFAGSDTANWNGKAERMDWEKDLVGKEVGNWKSDIEQQAGSISWTSEKYPNAIIYATPGWEGVDGIAVEVHESEDGYLDEPKLQKVVASGTDLWKTKEGYLALMAKIFTTLEKMLTPAEEIAEDHGTQINHDMNDDISADHTEPEHMVQNEEADPFGSIKTGIDKITMGDDDMDMGDDDRMMSLGGDQIKAGIESLMADGFDYREILQFVKDTIAAKRNF